MADLPNRKPDPDLPSGEGGASPSGSYPPGGSGGVVGSGTATPPPGGPSPGGAPYGAAYGQPRGYGAGALPPPGGAYGPGGYGAGPGPYGSGPQPGAYASGPQPGGYGGAAAGAPLPAGRGYPPPPGIPHPPGSSGSGGGGGGGGAAGGPGASPGMGSGGYRPASAGPGGGAGSGAGSGGYGYPAPGSGSGGYARPGGGAHPGYASPPPGYASPHPGYASPPPGYASPPPGAYGHAGAASGPVPSPYPGAYRSPAPGGAPLPGAAALQASALAPGTLLDGKYEIVAKLGEGGMGAVYRARHALLDRDVAVKVISGQMAHDPSFQARFFREAKVAMEFVHRHAITVRHFGVTPEGLYYMTMDYSTGESLRALAEREGPLPADRACKLLCQTLDALSEAHRKKIIHRDLKPDNVLLEQQDGGDFVKVLDFGLAKLAGAEDGLSISQGDAIVGTPAYMSPEQACGEECDQRTDIYACGIILYQLLSGRVPFTAPTARQVIMKQVSAPPPPLGEVMPPGATLPPGLDALVMKALEKEPGRRFQSAEQMRFALAGFAGLGGPSGTGLDAMTAGGHHITEDILGSLTGMTVDRYRILAPIGEGGMGMVYRAEHLLMHRPCAIKVIKGDLKKDPELISRFQREAQVSARFKHPSAVEVYDFGRIGENLFFMAMELVEGAVLTERLTPAKRIELKDSVEIISQVLEALAAAHEAGIVHRDLKPDNIMLREVGGWPNQVKVLDFGIAKIKDARGEASFETMAGSFCGTPMFASPEQCVGGSADGRADLYTTGFILYRMLTGKLPFESSTPSGYLGLHMAATPAPFAETAPDLKLPPGVERVVMKALEKDPADRYQSAREMAKALQEAADVHPAFDAGAHGIVLASGRHRGARASKKGLVAALAILVLAGGIAGASAWRLRAEPARLRLSTRPETASLALTGPDGALAAHAIEGGALALDGLAPGVYRLVVTAPDFDPVEREVELTKGRQVELDLDLPPSKVKLVAAAEARRAEAERARAAAVEAGGERLAPSPFGRGDQRLAEAATALEAGEPTRADELYARAAEAYAEAAKEGRRLAAEQAASRTRLEALAGEVEEARRAADAVDAEALAAQVYGRAQSEHKLGQGALERGNPEGAITRLTTARTLYLEAADTARALRARELADAKAALAKASQDAERAEAAARAPALFQAAWERAAEADGLIERDPRAAALKLREAAAGFATAAEAARFALRAEGLLAGLDEAARRSAAARAAAAAAGAEALAPGDHARAAGLLAEAGDAERRARADLARAGAAAAPPGEGERARLEATCRGAEERHGDAARAFEDAARTARREGELAAERRRQKLLALDGALSRAQARAAAFQALAPAAAAVKAEMAEPEAKARDAATQLALAEARAKLARQDGSDLAVIDDAAALADKAARVFEEAHVLTEAAITAARARPVEPVSGAAAAIELRLGAFRRAMEQKDIDALKGCFIEMPKNMEQGYRGLFADRNKSIKVTMGSASILSEREAEAVFEMVITEGSRDGRPSKAKLLLTPYGGAGWRVVEIQPVR